MKILKRIVTAALVTVTLLAMLGCTRNEPAQKVDIVSHEIESTRNIEGLELTPANKELIREVFTEIESMEQRVDELGLDLWLVKSPEVNIMLKDFIFRKKNKELILKLNDSDQAVLDTEIVQDMIKEQLTVNYAKSSGIVVTSEELANLVSQQRAFLYDDNLEAESRELVQEIMQHRIALTGLTDELFWQSDEVMKGYSNSLYISKLMQELLADESQKGMDRFKQLQEKLLKVFLEKYEVNMSVLKQI
ncbi:hypothetical protein ACK8P5_19995 [Paenibacillus sp. EC2-1]|uniref:hypothetical protein n=1 Tax=Paenibacillus sp. EC2-1 TaxID=3388665 RepID=UPI003BEF10A5